MSPRLPLGVFLGDKSTICPGPCACRTPLPRLGSGFEPHADPLSRKRHACPPTSRGDLYMQRLAERGTAPLPGAPRAALPSKVTRVHPSPGGATFAPSLLLPPHEASRGTRVHPPSGSAACPCLPWGVQARSRRNVSLALLSPIKASNGRHEGGRGFGKGLGRDPVERGIRQISTGYGWQLQWYNRGGERGCSSQVRTTRKSARL